MCFAIYYVFFIVNQQIEDLILHCIEINMSSWEFCLFVDIQLEIFAHLLHATQFRQSCIFLSMQYAALMNMFALSFLSGNAIFSFVFKKFLTTTPHAWKFFLKNWSSFFKKNLM